MGFVRLFQSKKFYISSEFTNNTHHRILLFNTLLILKFPWFDTRSEIWSTQSDSNLLIQYYISFYSNDHTT